jgi:DNA-binding SARP family transcriptional activator
VGTWIGLLGPLELRRAGDASVAVSGAKQRMLLGALALEAGQVLSVDALVDELWEDKPPPSAAHTLEANISRLRPTLGAVGLSIARRGAGSVLDVGDATLDVHVFQQADAAAREKLAGNPDAAAITEARAALATWRGRVLEDVPLGPRGRAAAARYMLRKFMPIMRRRPAYA